MTATANPAGTSVTCVLPPGIGIVTVTVTGPGGTSNALPFYYVDYPIPVSVAPASGAAEALSEVTIFGRHLLTVNQVLIGETVAVLNPPTSNNRISVAVPPIPPLGTAPWARIQDVSVRTAGGTTTLPASYTRFDPPAVMSLVPDTAIAGTQILINGTAFVSPMIRVHFMADGTQRDGVVVVNSSAQLLVTVPQGLTGNAEVHVDTLGGRSNAMTFTYLSSA